MPTGGHWCGRLCWWLLLAGLLCGLHLCLDVGRVLLYLW